MWLCAHDGIYKDTPAFIGILQLQIITLFKNLNIFYKFGKRSNVLKSITIIYGWVSFYSKLQYCLISNVKSTKAFFFLFYKSIKFSFCLRYYEIVESLSKQK